MDTIDGCAKTCNFFEWMTNCFCDEHKWLNAVEVELWELLIREMPQSTWKKPCNYPPIIDLAVPKFTVAITVSATEVQERKRWIWCTQQKVEQRSMLTLDCKQTSTGGSIRLCFLSLHQDSVICVQPVLSSTNVIRCVWHCLWKHFLFVIYDALNMSLFLTLWMNSVCQLM